MEEQFKWESPEQEKGYKNLVQWLRKNGQPELSKEGSMIAAYFIQKDHESHEWLMGMLQRVLAPIETQVAHIKAWMKIQ